jgi:hypothetical protein
MSVIENESPTGYDWLKSSHSSGDNNCVECARVPNTVPVRDSKNPNGPILFASKTAWNAFVKHIKS